MKFFSQLVLLPLILFGCAEPADVTGLWELEKVSVDMYSREYFNPIYLAFDKEGAFSASRKKGDLVGLYLMDGNELTLRSGDNEWFNTRWAVKNYKNQIILKGLESPYRTTELRFKNIAKFPSFSELLEKVTGRWELYKIVERGQDRRISQTFLSIENDYYSIFEAGKSIEKGVASIDSRHHKITFENSKTTWNIRFVWDELRLENKELDLVYRLRKSD